MIYNITVTQNGEDITSRLANHSAIDAWSPGASEDRAARQGEPIGTLANLVYGEAMVALGQIVDQGREWGPTDEQAEHLYALIPLVIEAGEGYIATPDGYLIHVSSKPMPVSTALHDWCIARLKDSRESAELEEEVSDAIIEREAEKLERLIFQIASSFVDNEFDWKE